MLLSSGLALLLVTIGLFRGFGTRSVSTVTAATGPGKGPVVNFRRAGVGAGALPTPRTPLPVPLALVTGPGQMGRSFRAIGARQAVEVPRLQGTQHAADLRDLVVFSAIALVVTAVASVGLGWLLAGRLLGPLRTITATARRASASNLHKRLAFAAGPTTS